MNSKDWGSNPNLTVKALRPAKLKGGQQKGEEGEESKEERDISGEKKTKMTLIHTYQKKSH